MACGEGSWRVIDVGACFLPVGVVAVPDEVEQPNVRPVRQRRSNQPMRSDTDQKAVLDVEPHLLEPRVGEPGAYGGSEIG